LIDIDMDIDSIVGFAQDVKIGAKLRPAYSKSNNDEHWAYLEFLSAESARSQQSSNNQTRKLTVLWAWF